jgi:hypothetical protein
MRQLTLTVATLLLTACGGAIQVAGTTDANQAHPAGSIEQAAAGALVPHLLVAISTGPETSGVLAYPFVHGKFGAVDFMYPPAGTIATGPPGRLYATDETSCNPYESTLINVYRYRHSKEEYSLSLPFVGDLFPIPCGIAVDRDAYLYLSYGLGSPSTRPRGRSRPRSIPYGGVLIYRPGAKANDPPWHAISTNGAHALAIDSHNELFVAEASQISVYSRTHRPMHLHDIVLPARCQAGALAFDAHNELYVVMTGCTPGGDEIAAYSPTAKGNDPPDRLTWISGADLIDEGEALAVSGTTMFVLSTNGVAALDTRKNGPQAAIAYLDAPVYPYADVGNVFAIAP